MMKTYQLYQVERFPNLQLGQQVKTVRQLQMFGGQEDVETTVTKVRTAIEGFDEYRVQSQVKIKTYGLIRYYDMDRGETVTRPFTEYLKPVDCHAYHSAAEGIVAFQAPHKICSAVKDNINQHSPDIRLTARKVDFDVIRQNHDAFAGAWFRKVSANIRAEGLHGDNVQEDPRFKELLSYAELSNLTLRYDHEAIHHNIMITGSSAVVFQQLYNNINVELALLKSVKQAILTDAWIP